MARLRNMSRDWTRGFFQKLGKHLGLSISTLRKEAVLAQEYNVREIQELDGQGVGWGMMTVVMHVPKETRQELLDRAIDKKWGVLDLKAAARRRFRKRNQGGRPMTKPESVEEGLKQLQEQARRWLVYYFEVWLNTSMDEFSGLKRKESEAAFQAKLKAARKAVDRVEATARSIKKALDDTLYELKKGR